MRQRAIENISEHQSVRLLDHKPPPIGSPAAVHRIPSEATEEQG
jgi:hypothetical protein